MICKICGCEMKNNGDWFACPTCGSVHFGPDPDNAKNADTSSVKVDKKIFHIIEEPTEPKEKSVKNAELSFDFEEEFFKKAETPVKEEVEPVIKAELPVTEEVKPAEKAEPPVQEAAKPVVEEAKPIKEKTNPVEKELKHVDEDVKPVEEKVKPVIKEETPTEIAEIPVEKDEPIDESNDSDINNVPKPEEKQEIFNNEPMFRIKDFEEESVKVDAFTIDKDAFKDNYASFLNEIDDTADEKPLKREEIDEEKPEEADGEEQGEKKKKRKLKDVIDFMLPIVAAIVIAFVLKTFIIANAKVPTGSMIDTINIGDRIIASRLAYKSEAPSRYDIVLFYYPDDESDIFVKRVLGLPGETLEVIDGVVYVTTTSGKTIQTDQSFVNPAEIPRGDSGPYYIPEKGEKITFDGSYCYAENGMVLGRSEFLDKYCDKDERDNYVIAENLYFMMGDNRNYSSDSREWTFPYVAENKIIGKVLFRYYPFDSMGKIE